MIKDIIVNLAGKQRAADYAISVARVLGARVTGVALVYDVFIPPPGYITPEVMELQRRESEDATKNAIRQFTAAADRGGVLSEPLTFHSALGHASRRFGYLTRCFDLAVVDQNEPDKTTADDTVIESALFESGRPVIVVPYIQVAPLKLDNVLVCWDGSRAAARALADSMPLLTRAGRVEIVIVTDEPRNEYRQIEGADVGQHLARHGLNFTIERISSGGLDVGNVLLSHAADTAADFIVMGGYGHSRVREFVLGGVTRTILSTMTVPVLMSH